MASDEDFDSSPRPVKKRRTTKAAQKQSTTRPAASTTANHAAVDDFVASDGHHSPAAEPKRGRLKKKAVSVSDDDSVVIPAAASKPSKRKTKAKQILNDSDDAFDPPTKTTKAPSKRRSMTHDSDASVASAPSKNARAKRSRTSAELDDEGFAKPQKPKHRIHIPEQGQFKDILIGPNDAPPSTAPWDIRGPIWKINPTAAKSSHFGTLPVSHSHAGHSAGTLPRIDQVARTSPSSVTPGSPKVTPHVQISPPMAAASDRKQNTEACGIPNSDDLDADDWALLNAQELRPRPAEPSSHREQARFAQIGRATSAVGPADQVDSSRSLTGVPHKTPAEQIEDSLLIEDDFDMEDWDALDQPVSLSKEPQAQKPHQTAQESTTLASKPAQALQTGPFIEIDDISSDEDCFERQLPEPTRSLYPGTTTESLEKPPAPATSRTNLQPRPAIPAASYVAELEDLPSDAFDSDPSSPARETTFTPLARIEHENGAARQRNLAGPRNGLVQTTLFGGKANPPEVASVANKRHNWPLATQQEAPTHHRLDESATGTWVYPTNLGTIRDYQYNIVSRGLFHNLLVALPTGLGKTFIAATVMLNWFRWAPDSQIVFVAPTKPLVAQQIDACFKVVGIPRSETVMLTGETKPAIRAEEWKEKRVFFMTPQTIINDLKHGYCDPKRIVLVVVDEAHRATGNYAYVEVIKFIRRFNQSFRVLALTATPGSSVESVQQVIDGLDISRVEIRTETSIDIRQYVHARDIDTMKFDNSDEQNLIMELLSKAIQPVLTKLNGQNAYWLKDPMKLTAYGCTMAQQQWSKSEAGRKAPQPIKGMVASIFPVLASLAHSISLLRFHGIGPFFRSVTNFRNEVDGGGMKSKYAKQIRDDQNFNKMMGTVQSWVRNTDFLGHPKLEYLRNVVMEHFLDSKDANTRIMIFAHWRDSAEEIVRVMNRNQPMIRAHVFVGQAASKGSEGMNQARQLEVIQQFKEGKYNTIVATSIGEEGLDIGEVDLIVCYDASASPIRMLQRMGRTGRKRKGNIVLLLQRGKEDTDFEKAKDNYEKMQAMISDGNRFTFHDDKSPRILPRGVNPVVDKRIVDIPVENSQTELPEPNRRKKVPKKPPKKFHMPDNVRTGFVNASRMEESGEEGEAPLPPKAKRSSTKKAPSLRMKAAPSEPESLPLPFLEDVLLNKVQERELERKYKYVSEGIDGVPVVTAPRLDRLPPEFPGPSSMIKHGRFALETASMMRKIRGMNVQRKQEFEDQYRPSDLGGDVDHLLADSTLGDLAVEILGDDETDLPVLSVPRKQAPRPRKTPVKPTKVPAKPNRAPRGARQNSSDMEGDESEPEATPANMRLATQGIDLGSEDTMDEWHNDEEPESELAEFVVGSDAPMETVSSSFPQISEDGSPEVRKASGQTECRIVDDIISSGEATIQPRKRLQRGRRALLSDSDDE